MNQSGKDRSAGVGRCGALPLVRDRSAGVGRCGAPRSCQFTSQVRASVNNPPLFVLGVNQSNN